LRGPDAVMMMMMMVPIVDDVDVDDAVMLPG
jgi:hypothetical protein